MRENILCKIKTEIKISLKTCIVFVGLVVWYSHAIIPSYNSYINELNTHIQINTCLSAQKYATVFLLREKKKKEIPTTTLLLVFIANTKTNGERKKKTWKKRRKESKQKIEGKK